MPAPDHLIPLLTALGDGGTVATAERIASAAGTGQPVTVDLVIDAIGDGATRDVAERVAALYVVEPSGLDEFHPDTTNNPTPAAVEPVEVPSGPADEDVPGPADVREPTAADIEDDDIDWDDQPYEDTTPVEEAAPASAATIRAWAKRAGVKVPARGGIPADVRAAYDNAH